MLIGRPRLPMSPCEHTIPLGDDGSSGSGSEPPSVLTQAEREDVLQRWLLFAAQRDPDSNLSSAERWRARGRGEARGGRML